jgi:hypothetical protein
MWNEKTTQAKNPLNLFSRRSLLKSVAVGASAAMFPSGFAGAVPREPGMLTTQSSSSKSTPPTRNPHWYGFNLLEYFSTDPDWMKYFPYKNDGMFVEDDFRWIRDWGFNWVRLPMDYRFWTTPDLFTINEKQVEPIDRAIRLGEKYGVHINICLHRAPGLCILDTMDVKLTGINVTKDKDRCLRRSPHFRCLRSSVDFLRRPLQRHSEPTAQLQSGQRANPTPDRDRVSGAPAAWCRYDQRSV